MLAYYMCSLLNSAQDTETNGSACFSILDQRQNDVNSKTVPTGLIKRRIFCIYICLTILKSHTNEKTHTLRDVKMGSMN